MAGSIGFDARLELPTRRRVTARCLAHRGGYRRNLGDWTRSINAQDMLPMVLCVGGSVSSNSGGAALRRIGYAEPTGADDLTDDALAKQVML